MQERSEVLVAIINHHTTTTQPHLQPPAPAACLHYHQLPGWHPRRGQVTASQDWPEWAWRRLPVGSVWQRLL